MRAGIRTISVSCAVVFGLSGYAAGQGSGKATTRFAGMDRDGDGVITRSEWRGSAESFRVHDWNGDGVLSGDEVRPGARRPGRQADQSVFDSPDRDYQYDDWTERGFTSLDHNRDGRISRDEWHFDLETFRRADHNRDGALSRSEFLGSDTPNEDDDLGDTFRNLDANRDGRITRDEWHGSRGRFDALDDNRDGVLTRREVAGGDVPPDLFSSVDVNRDGNVTLDEWHWSRASFDARDTNRDQRLTRSEFARTADPRSDAYKSGYDRGMTEGRAAGREDHDRNQGWDLEGQRELETADSGYEPRFGSKSDYQMGYRDGFRRGYREGFGPR